MLRKYADCMEEIKKRTRVIQGFLGRECHAIYLQTTVESICLQIRKILELIAMASLVANETEYKKHRANFSRDWHAKRILENLEKANPAFYPQPTRQILDKNSGRVIETVKIASGFLTRKEYEKLYDRCGGILHADNPFSKKRDIESFFQEIPSWLEKIIALLNHHEIQLIDEDRHLKVLMQSDTDGIVHVWEFERVVF